MRTPKSRIGPAAESAPPAPAVHSSPTTAVPPLRSSLGLVDVCLNYDFQMQIAADHQRAAQLRKENPDTPLVFSASLRGQKVFFATIRGSIGFVYHNIQARRIPTSHAAPAPALPPLTPCHPLAGRRALLIYACASLSLTLVNTCTTLVPPHPLQAPANAHAHTDPGARQKPFARFPIVATVLFRACPGRASDHIPRVDPNLPCVKRAKSVSRTETNTDRSYLPKIWDAPLKFPVLTKSVFFCILYYILEIIPSTRPAL